MQLCACPASVFQWPPYLCCSSDALETFLKVNKLSHVIRAHECKAAGFQVRESTHAPRLSSTVHSLLLLLHRSSSMAGSSPSSLPHTTVGPPTRQPVCSWTIGRSEQSDLILHSCSHVVPSWNDCPLLCVSLPYMCIPLCMAHGPYFQAYLSLF